MKRLQVLLCVMALPIACAKDLTAPGPGLDVNGIRYGANVALSGVNADSLDVRVWVHNNTDVRRELTMGICPIFNTKITVLDASLSLRWTSSAWDAAKNGPFGTVCPAVGLLTSLRANETMYPSYARLTMKVADIRGDSLPPGDYIVKIDALDQKQIATAKITFR